MSALEVGLTKICLVALFMVIIGYVVGLKVYVIDPQLPVVIEEAVNIVTDAGDYSTDTVMVAMEFVAQMGVLQGSIITTLST